MERGERSKNLLKVAGGALGVEDEDSVTLKRRPSAHPDLVASFREMLEEFSKESTTGDESKRFTIFIDELDKLSTREELIDAVNGLKDLFHIPGVHFIVSVSTDALASFESKGMPTRDAFDSAFDTIVQVERLKLEESLRVVLSRAAGFPVVLGYFCHAWSGGLPRDLLRGARRCVELQRTSNNALPAIALIRGVVISDIKAHLEAAARGVGRNSSEADELMGFRRMILKLENGDETPASVLSFSRLSINEDETVDRARLIIQVGMVILEYFSHMLPEFGPPRAWDGSAKSTVSIIANVASTHEGLRAIRDEALEEIVTRAFMPS
jgi:hypothetical protein